jgi:uncharacterized protein involved in high-affinity Fe2+ transport
MISVNFLFSAIFVVSIMVLVSSSHSENYEEDEYDYDRENPNALNSGQVAGTVYVQDINASHGLSWIL